MYGKKIADSFDDLGFLIYIYICFKMFFGVLIILKWWIKVYGHIAMFLNHFWNIQNVHQIWPLTLYLSPKYFERFKQFMDTSSKHILSISQHFGNPKLTTTKKTLPDIKHVELICCFLSCACVFFGCFFQVLFWHQKGALCALSTLEGGPMCFIDTSSGPYMLYWHQKGALCAFMTPEGIPFWCQKST